MTNDNTIYVEIDMHKKLDGASFDKWREAMDEFEKIHTNCTIDVGTYRYDKEVILDFCGRRDKNEYELEQDRLKAEKAEKDRLAREAKIAEEKAQAEKLDNMIAVAKQDQNYQAYKEFTKKYWSVERYL